MTGDKHELALRFGATRLCLYLLCGNRACRRAWACKGDARKCTGLFNDWLEAVDAEKEVRGNFSPPQREIKTLAEARAYHAWHKAIEQAAANAKEDTRSYAEAREQLKRMIDAKAQYLASKAISEREDV